MLFFPFGIKPLHAKRVSPTDPQKTIIRHNVFIKTDRASPDGDRPNVLIGGFPGAGAGSQDLYEIYGNFFYYNPRESLIQGSGRVSIHDNIFVGGNPQAILMQDHDLPLQLAHIYNNTIYTNGSGIVFGSKARVSDAVVGNLIFAATPIRGTIGNQQGNVADAFSSASDYVVAPSMTLGSMDFFPLKGKCCGAALDLTAFAGEKDFERDFHEKVVFVKPDVAGLRGMAPKPHAAGAASRYSLQEIGFH